MENRQGGVTQEPPVSAKVISGMLVPVTADGKQLQLPIWPESMRGIPNSILRSALFGAIRRGPRAFQQRVQKASLNGLVVIHTGPTLDQADLDVWEYCLHLAQTNGLGCLIFFSACNFLKGINRAGGGKDIEWLMGAFAPGIFCC
jgi:hypothetical protein